MAGSRARVLVCCTTGGDGNGDGGDGIVGGDGEGVVESHARVVVCY